ncbi:hypothetical protein GmHk_17G049379 [Glycine max]|nr:hypothetical protein GmHk_17G049379 [Glycine max]
MKQELKEAIKIEFSQRGSQYSPPIEADIQQMGARVNTKGSNVETGVNPLGEEDVVDVISTMGLYVQCDHSTHLVALGKIYGGGSTIHNVAYADDMKYSMSGRPLTHSLHGRHSLSNLYHMRTHLLQHKVAKPVRRSNDVEADDPLRGLIMSLCDIYDKPVELLFNGTKFGIHDVDASVFLTYSDVNEIISGDKCLNISILQLLIMGHWQLVVLCPMKEVIVWFCSLCKKPDIHIKAAINNSAMNPLKTTLHGHIDQVAPKWIEVKWFGDGTLLDKETMTTIRKKCETYFLKVKNIRCRMLNMT